MPAWITGILASIAQKFAETFGKWIIGNIKSSALEAKRIKDLGSIQDAQAKAAYVKSMLSR